MPIVALPRGRVIEVDDVDRWNASDLIERKVIIADFMSRAGDKLAHAEASRDAPNVVHDLLLLLRSQAVDLLINLELRVGDHVEQHAAAIAIARRIGNVLVGKMLAAQKVRIALAVIDQLFAVE